MDVNVLDFLGFATDADVVDIVTSEDINPDELQVVEVSLSTRTLPSIFQLPSLFERTT